jgi:hypothetical protein
MDGSIDQIQEQIERAQYVYLPSFGRSQLLQFAYRRSFHSNCL